MTIQEAIRDAPLECMYCPNLGPMYPVDADHPGWMCDTCYQKAQDEYLEYVSYNLGKSDGE